MTASLTLGEQLLVLFVLAIPVATVAWTVTHEEVFREPREYCVRQSRTRPGIWARKFFYLFTCEYCFSHWVAVGMLALTDFRLVYADWRGYLVSGFSLVWIANLYMSLYARLRLDIKDERLEIESRELEIESQELELQERTKRHGTG